jgi:hypothetical protein
MILLNKQDIQKIFNMKEAIETSKEAFRLYSEEELLYRCVQTLMFQIRGPNALYDSIRGGYRLWRR